MKTNFVVNLHLVCRNQLRTGGTMMMASFLRSMIHTGHNFFNDLAHDIIKNRKRDLPSQSFP